MGAAGHHLLQGLPGAPPRPWTHREDLIPPALQVFFADDVSGTGLSKGVFSKKKLLWDTQGS